MGQVFMAGLDTVFARNAGGVEKASLGVQKLMGQAQINADNMLAEVNANAENVLRGQNNTLMAARSALANMERSERNEAILKSAGRQQNAAGLNILRTLDSRTAGSLERRISDAEQQGAVTAATAARGVGGATSRMLKLALQATAARRDTQIEGREQMQTYDMMAERAGIMPGAIAALDEGQTFAAIDVRKVVAQKTIEPMWQRDFFNMRLNMQSQVGHLAGGAAGSIYQAYTSRGTGSPYSSDTSSVSGGGNDGYTNGGGNGWYSTNTSNSVGENGDYGGYGGGGYSNDGGGSGGSDGYGGDSYDQGSF
jgi:hypothetical protein